MRPGLHTFGSPNRESKVLVTANYTLSFDALRSALEERDAFLLVLDTQGINVWCAAGKGTFGTDELHRAIEVDSEVGCTSAMIMAALKGRDEVNCGEDCCC